MARKPKLTRADIDAIVEGLARRGLVDRPPDPPPRKLKAKDLVTPAFVPPCTFVVPIDTFSTGNGRDWRRRSAATQAARLAVSRAFGPHLRAVSLVADCYHAGNPVRVRLVRLGGAKLDPMANLPMSLKAVEDAVALMLGADDGDVRWKAEAAQEPGGPVGVRIELEPVRSDRTPEGPA